MLSRRDFLHHSSLLAFAPIVPAFVPRLARAAAPQGDARVLVVIQLDGGNDGLNTVVPFTDDAYLKARTTLRLRDGLLKLDERAALHPAMRGAADLLNDGRLAIVQGVGYPNPNRSHFESMAAWHTARLPGGGDRAAGMAAASSTANGWIGSALDPAVRAGAGGPDAVYVGEGDLPRALLGRRSMAASLSRADDLAVRLPAAADGDPARLPQQSPGGVEEDVAAFVRRQVLGAVGSARQLADAARATGAGAPGTDARYPDTVLAQRLSLVARLLKAGGGGTRVYYVVQGGYDTHGAQLAHHAELLRDLSRSLKAFLDDLRADGLDDRVLVMSFSEFGRRVAENGSGGTEHGAAGPVILAGPAVRAGLHGDPPQIDDGGDVKQSIDFRRVYATLLQDWLGLPGGGVLGDEFGPLPLLRPA